MNRLSDSRSTSHRLTDEELDYYGDLYVRSGLRNAGVEFETYLTDPEQYLRRCGQLPKDAGSDGRRNGRLMRLLRLRPQRSSTD